MSEKRKSVAAPVLIALAVVDCAFCQREAPRDFEDVVNEGWIPSYFAGQQQMEGSVCPECCDQHLRLSDDGEWEQKVPPAIAHRYN